jgi:hypothetical protein
MKLIPILALFSLFGCLMQTTAIGDINGNPDKYAGKEVTVAGNVTSVCYGLCAMKGGGFVFDDGTGAIRSSPIDRFPQVGDEVTVTGIVIVTPHPGGDSIEISPRNVSWKK